MLLTRFGIVLDEFNFSVSCLDAMSLPGLLMCTLVDVILCCEYCTVLRTIRYEYEYEYTYRSATPKSKAFVQARSAPWITIMGKDSCPAGASVILMFDTGAARIASSISAPAEQPVFRLSKYHTQIDIELISCPQNDFWWSSHLRCEQHQSVS